MRVLVTGASGMLGATLVERWKERYEVYATDRTNFDPKTDQNFLCFDLKRESYEDLMNWARPDVVIHCGALTNVDYCENHEAEALLINGQSVEKLLEAGVSTRIVFISSDAVFPEGESFRSENSKTRAINAYGRSKLYGEQALLRSRGQHVVVRTTIVGVNRNPSKQSFVDWFIKSLSHGKAVSLFEDAIFTPISIWHFADALEWFIENPFRGVVHVAGCEATSKYEFGLRICEQLGFDSRLLQKAQLKEELFDAYRSKDQSLDSKYFEELSSSRLPDVKEVVYLLAQEINFLAQTNNETLQGREIGYGRQYLDEKDYSAVVGVLKGDWLTQGSVIREFEAGLEQVFGARHACAVSSGTAALHLSGLALGWGPGDLVVTTPITFLASANCARFCGAEVDFSDINPETCTIDAGLLESKLAKYQREGRKVKAIVAVDYAGHPCDWEELRAIADKYQVQLVNDNCHAMGSEYMNDRAYATKYADAVTHSYHPVKHITTGEGGAILCNEEEIYRRARLLRTHGTEQRREVKQSTIEEPWRYDMVDLGFNYRITDFQCALGLTQLRKLDWFLSERRRLAGIYHEALRDVAGITCPIEKASVKHAYHIFPIQADFESLGISKGRLFSKFRESSINLQVHYVPIHLQPYYQNRYGFRLGDFPNAEHYYSRTLTLPLYPGLKDEDVYRTCDILINASKNRP